MGAPRPSRRVLFEGDWIDLYTEEDRARVKAYREQQWAGRPRMWTPEQAADRNRRKALAAYYARRAPILAARGDEKGAKAAQRRADRMRGALRHEARVQRKRIFAR